METDEKNLIGTPKKREGDAPGYTWTIHYEQRGAGSTSPALSYDDGSGVVAAEWPEEECSIDTIRERWGEGCYRVRWWGRSAADGSRSQRGAGKIIELAPIAPRPRIAPPAPAAVAASVDPLAMYRAAQADSLQGMAAIASLLQGISGGAARTQSAEVAEERFSLFRRETLLAVQQMFDTLSKANAATLEAMARQLADATKDIAQLREELAQWEETEEDEDEDDEDDAPPRERPNTAKDIVREHALTGLDSALQNMGPAVMPAVIGFVEAKKREAEARAKQAEDAARPPSAPALTPPATAAAE